MKVYIYSDPSTREDEREYTCAIGADARTASADSAEAEHLLPSLLRQFAVAAAVTTAQHQSSLLTQ